MKTLRILILSMFMAIAAVNVNVVKAQVSVGADVTLNVFHNGLNSYGHWVKHPSYGEVWVSNEKDFIPYRTKGHWAYTNDGWTWVSDYSWGWAPFHYGRWDHDVAYGGYYWVPGYDWGPAWVSWRHDNANYGWAPLRPGVNVGIGVSFGSDIPADRWTFVPNRYIASRSVGRYYIDRRRNDTYIRSTVILNNVHNNGVRIAVIGGPQRTEVERYTHTKITTYAVANSSRPGTRIEKNTINIYRPVVNKTTVVNKEVVNKNKTIVNNNQKTTINKNSNNKTTVNNTDKKTVNNKSTVNNDNKKVTNNDKTTVNNNQKKSEVTNKSTVNNNDKKTVNDNSKTVAKKPAAKKSTMTKKAAKPAKKPAAKPAAKPDNNDDNKKPE